VSVATLAPPAAGWRADPAALPWPVWLFIASMVVPAGLVFEIAGLMISPQRLVLLAFALGVGRWLWRTRELRLPEALVLVAAFWAFTATFRHLPPGAAIERGGAFVLETAVAYLLPVAFLGALDLVRQMARAFCVVIAILGALAAVEAIDGVHFIANAAAELMERPEPFLADTRLGLLRARVTFSHQILFGVFCAALFAILWYEARTVRERMARTVFCLTGVFFSLSSAALLLMALQLAMVAVERATRRLASRFAVIAAGCALLALAVEAVFGGGLTGFVTRYLSLNPETAYYRQLIWLHVTDDILAHPLAGTGGPWTRPAWMVESIDHVFFAKAIGYGIPPVALISIAAFLTGRRLFRHPAGPGTGVFRSLRLGWAFCVGGIAIAGLTVDYFGRALPFVMFILGLGAALDRIGGSLRRQKQ